MQSQTFFIPAKSESLAHYFGRAIILPSNFYNNKPVDFQNRSKSSILLSRRKWTTETDCALEVVLTDQEMSQVVTIDDDILSYAGALPISRVNAIYFNDRRQSETTLWNINNGDAFLPDRLIKIESKSSEYSQFGNITEQESPSDDLFVKSTRFDRYLGSVAFMNTAASPDTNFAKDYFSVLGYFNTVIRTQFRSAIEKGLASFDDSLTTLYRKENSWSDIQSLILEEVDVEDVDEMAKRINVRIDRKYGVIDFKKLPQNKNIYLLALLATYGIGKPKGIPELIMDVIAKEPSEKKAEEIAFIFGLHLRYSRLRNHYGYATPFKIKFGMDSKLDYYIIESVFQSAFSGRTSSELEYIDNIAPKEEASPILMQGGYQILDVFIPEGKRQGINEPATTKTIGREKDVREVVQRMVNWLSNNFSKIAEADLQSLLSIIEKDHVDEITALKKENAQLRASYLDQINSRVEKKEEQPEKISLNPISIGEELYDKDMKQLKGLAKKAGVSPDIIESVKSTKRGFDTLTSLIKEKVFQK